ncbi:MAG: dihydroneopterin aldolase [Candidatus Geothermincolia bacterium]
MVDGPCAIFVEGIEVFAHHGVFPEEKERGQRFLIDVRLEMSAPPGADELASTVDYAEVAGQVKQLSTEASYDLIETLAGQIASSLLEKWQVRRATVTVRKPDVPMPVPVACVGVTVTVEMSGRPGYFTGEDGGG